MLSDSHDVDDLMPLPGSGSLADLADLPIAAAAKVSRFYLGTLPASEVSGASRERRADQIWEVDEQVAQLQVSLPDGRVLLRHNLEALRWLPSTRGSQSRVSCSAAGGHWDADLERCSERHVVARLCYAISQEGVVQDGALASDCEFGQRSPVYVPMRGRSGLSEVQILIRSRSDAYVLASEVTKGCSNCFGSALGQAKSSGLALHACGTRPGPVSPGVWRRFFDPRPAAKNCFGVPRRFPVAAGFGLLAAAAGLLSVALAPLQRGAGADAFRLFCKGTGPSILLAAMAVALMLTGVAALARLWRPDKGIYEQHWISLLSLFFIALLFIAGGVGDLQAVRKRRA